MPHKKKNHINIRITPSNPPNNKNKRRNSWTMKGRSRKESFPMHQRSGKDRPLKSFSVEVLLDERQNMTG